MNGLHGGSVLFNMLVYDIIKQHTDLNINLPHIPVTSANAVSNTVLFWALVQSPDQS